MATQDHPRYAEWKAAFERYVTAQDRLLAASASEAADAETEQAEALAAYDKIRFDIVARGGRAFGRKGGERMIMLRVEPSLFYALRAGFEAAACSDDAPISKRVLSRLRPTLAAAAATAPRGRPILVPLESLEELYALGDCFAVGGEGHPRVTGAQWDAINALVDQAAKATA